MRSTYDVLRESGLVPDLRCHGCRNVISGTVIPWPGDGYVTHPNNRCARAALNRPLTSTTEPEKITT